MPLDSSKYSPKPAQLPNVNRPQAPSDRPPSPSPLSQSQQTAQRAAEQTQIALVSGHQERLVALNNALDKAEQRREETLERLSDRVAYLQDGDLFMHDLLKRSQQKLQGDDKRQDKEQASTTAIDALIDAFDVIGDWELPAIAPSTVAGALPL